MGTATLGARLVAVLSLGAAVVFAPVAWADFSGGGPAKSDCYIVYKGINITSGANKSECTDGDPACDTDGQCQGTCSFGITACFNDPDIAGCTPSNVTSVTVNGGSLNVPTVPSSENICGSQAIVAVPVKQGKKGPKKGKLKVKVSATSISKPKKDKDKFTLFCLPRVGDCPPQPGTTTTTIPSNSACCGLPSDPQTTASFLNFSTVTSSGDCGDIIDAGGMVVQNIACAGLYTGGGGSAVPLPYAVPDQGSAISAITACTGQTATVGPTTSDQTGSLNNCTSAACRFGAPLAVPNPVSTPTSVCVLNTLSSGVSGTVDCGTGESTLSAPLSSVIFLTGDTSTDPAGTIAGIQPCPLCSNSVCIGGTNNSNPCVAGTSTVGGNPSYPTSNDCPPDPMTNIGTLPVAFSLTSGTVTWSGTPATNDSGSTVSTQNRVFSGFCRDTDGTGSFDGTSADTATLCWENGMAVGAACAQPFESCEQRNNGAFGGAFGGAGGSNRTITAIGSAATVLGGPAPATLVSIFTIRPTFTATVDAAGDLPGPGAVALPGTASLCADAMACP
jgi:hypothetical protein